MTTSRSLIRRVWENLSWLDRLLPVFIILAMILGVLLSVYVPTSRRAFEETKIEGVSFPLAIGLIVMMVPPLCKVEWEKANSFLQFSKYGHQLIISLILNWIICPFLMLALAWLTLFDQREYREGIIMIGIARCIAMVLLWNEIALGNNDLCSVIVFINSLLQIVLYAPYQRLMVGVIGGQVQSSTFSVAYSTVARSIGFFLGIPLGIGLALRLLGILLFRGNVSLYDRYIMRWISPWALIGLIYTIIVIFIQQGNEVIKNIGLAFRCFVPLTAYFFLTWFGGFWLVRYLSDWLARNKLTRKYGSDLEREAIFCGCEKNIAGGQKWSKKLCAANYEDTITQVFTAASNNFELSLAVAISIYGADSKQAVAATFGPLLEVPILLCLSFVARYSKEALVWKDAEEMRGTEI